MRRGDIELAHVSQAGVGGVEGEGGEVRDMLAAGVAAAHWVTV